MVAVNLNMVNTTPGTLLAKGIGPVPPGEEWLVDVRVCNSGTANDVVDLRVRNTDGSNACYRANGHSVERGAPPYDLEVRLAMNAGQELWARSGAGHVDVSYSGTKRSTAD